MRTVWNKILIVLIIVFIFYEGTYKPYRQAKFVHGMNAKEFTLLKLKEYFQKNLSYNTYGNSTVKQQMIIFSYNLLRQNQSTEVIELCKWIAEEYEKEYFKSPYNAKITLLLAGYYMTLSSYKEEFKNKADFYLIKSMEIMPNNPFVEVAIKENDKTP